MVPQAVAGQWADWQGFSNSGSVAFGDRRIGLVYSGAVPQEFPRNLHVQPGTWTGPDDPQTVRSVWVNDPGLGTYVFTVSGRGLGRGESLVVFSADAGDELAIRLYREQGTRQLTEEDLRRSVTCGTGDLYAHDSNPTIVTSWAFVGGSSDGRIILTTGRTWTEQPVFYVTVAAPGLEVTGIEVSTSASTYLGFGFTDSDLTHIAPGSQVPAWDFFADVPSSLADMDASSFITLDTQAKADAARERMVRYIWPVGGWPGSTFPSKTDVVYQARAVPRMPSEGLPPLPRRGMVLHLDATLRASVMLDESGGVQRWIDMSGRGHDATQPDRGARPKWAAGAPLGERGVRFDGVDDRLDIANASALVPGELTVFVVVSPESTTNTPYPVLLAKTPLSSSYLFHLSSTPGDGFPLARVRTRDGSVLDAVSKRRVMLSPEIWSLTYSRQGQLRFFRSGALAGEVAGAGAGAAAQGSGPVRIGSGDDAQINAFQGSVSEVIVYDRLLSERERQSVDMHLALKHQVPLSQPQSVVPDALSGLDVTKVNRIERWHVSMEYGMFSVAYLVSPAIVNARANRLVVVHQGHQLPGDPALTAGDLAALANELLDAGYPVAVLQMPLAGENSTQATLPQLGTVALASHTAMSKLLEDARGSFLRFFFEPIVAVVNQFERTVPAGDGVCVIGFSGGGWAAQVYAAMDRRVSLSVSIAGSYPTYVKKAYAPYGQGWPDVEDAWNRLFNVEGGAGGSGIVNMLELYVLGSAGPCRQQLQVFNVFDSCCHQGSAYKHYQSAVAGAVSALGPGTFRVAADVTHRSHALSAWARREAIWPALREAEACLANPAAPGRTR